MSENELTSETEEIIPSSVKKTTKKAAKKTAKKAAKKTAKKATAKKAAKKAAKKVAKKAAKKTATKSAEKVVSDAEKIAAALKSSNVDIDDSMLQAALAAVMATKNAQTADAPIEPKERPTPKKKSPISNQTELPLVTEETTKKHKHEKKNNSRSDSRREKNFKKKKGRNRDRDGDGEPHQRKERKKIELEGPPVDVDGMLEIAPKGFGFLRIQSQDYAQVRTDVFVSPEIIRKHGLRIGVWIHGVAMQGPRGPQLAEIKKVNGIDPEKAKKFPHFEELKAINPNKRIAFETESNKYTTRVVDIVAPVGRGQRGLIVSPPRSGKTTLLHDIAMAVKEKHSESLHLMIWNFPDAEIYASSNDSNAREHTRLAELCIERAKRLVEAGEDVFLLMDSITRLARAYNSSMRGGKGRGVQSGGIVSGALEVPRRLFAAARNTKNAGSLTILATALVQTNSRADEAIFLEFKGTGNMEFVLDRKIAEQYMYPAADIFKSGTRREELLLPEHSLHKIHLIRRGLTGHYPDQAMQRLLYFIEKFPNNAQMLMEIKG